MFISEGTGHIDAFGIINMNGRVYDPATAMFMNTDPLLQSPDNWVNYNRYSYCFNNPLIYSDPSGYANEASTERQPWEILRDGGTWANYSAALIYGNGGYTGGDGGGGGYHYLGGSYFNSQGEPVPFSEVNNNYILPNASYRFSGEAAQTIFRQTVEGFNLYTIKFASGYTSYATSIGDIGNPIVSSNGGLNFSNKSVTLTSSFSYWEGENDQVSQNNIYFYSNEEIVTSVAASASIYKKLPTTMNPILSTHYGEVNFKGGKFMGKIGIAGNLVSTYISIVNIKNDPYNVENYSDALFTGIGWVPVYGDFGALLYMGAKDQINIRKENILNNRDIDSGVYVPATGDVWIYN